MSPTLRNTVCIRSPQCLPVIRHCLCRRRRLRWPRPGLQSRPNTCHSRFFLPLMMNTNNGSKAYGMISYAKYIFPPLPVMIEKLIFDRAYTGLHVVTNM